MHLIENIIVDHNQRQHQHIHGHSLNLLFSCNFIL